MSNENEKENEADERMKEEQPLQLHEEKGLQDMIMIIVMIIVMIMMMIS